MPDPAALLAARKPWLIPLALVLMAIPLTGLSSPAIGQDDPSGFVIGDDDSQPAYPPLITGNTRAKIDAELEPAQRAAFAALIDGLPEDVRAAVLEFFEQLSLGHSGVNAGDLLSADAAQQQKFFGFLQAIGSDGRQKVAALQEFKHDSLISHLAPVPLESALAVQKADDSADLSDDDARLWRYLHVKTTVRVTHAWARAKADTAPWQIQLSRTNDSARQIFTPSVAAEEIRTFGRTLDASQHNHICGGVRLDAHWVLTAAHCIGWEPMARFLDNRTIRTGSLQLGTGGQKWRIRGVVVHAGFDENTLSDDIALFRLADDSVADDGYVPAISLPRANYPRLAREPLILTGWGRTGDTDDFKQARDLKGNPNRFSNGLLIARLNHVPTKRCEAYGKDLFEKVGHRLPGQLCADSPDKADACQGDSGGPLIWRDGKNAAWLIGLVSFGKGRTCGTSGLPGVYTDVQYYVRTGWIDRAKAQMKDGAVIKVP